MMIGLVAFWLILPAFAVWLLLGQPQRDAAAGEDSSARGARTQGGAR